MTPQAVRIESEDNTKSVLLNEIACVASGAWTRPTHSDAKQRITSGPRFASQAQCLRWLPPFCRSDLTSDRTTYSMICVEP